MKFAVLLERYGSSPNWCRLAGLLGEWENLKAWNVATDAGHPLIHCLEKCIHSKLSKWSAQMDLFACRRMIFECLLKSYR